MMSNSKKRAGFGLTEVIISMAILSIISISVYNGYMIMIKQIKLGQVKQTSALIGKQISEEIKAITETSSFSISEENILSLTDDIELSENSNGEYIGKVFFDKDGIECEEESYEYTSTITLEKTKAYTNDEKVENIELSGIGTLYDITVNVTNKDEKTLFTGYSKQNIKLTE
jgi:prepilin-type N-terminal cleavage/methylation domain-containing protein